MSQFRADTITDPRLYSWLAFIFAAALVAAINILIAPVHQVFHRVLVFVLLMLSLAQIRYTGWRGLFSLIVLPFIALDLTLTLWAWFSFHSAFSYGFAQSVLETSADEALSMLGLYWRYAVLFAGMLALFLFSVSCTPALPRRFCRWPIIALIALLAGYSVQAILHQLRRNNLQSPVQRVLGSTPLSNANVFLQAIQDRHLIASIAESTPHYQLATRDTGIDNYVLVIGESERTTNMSIYGYGRETTPELEAQRKNLLLFTQAISGAPVTITAVPLALTADTPEDHDISRYSDNIINVANQAGFTTYWFSRQGSGGAHNNVITAIASGAHHSQWVNSGYDDALLPLFRHALQQPGKKLIVLHFYGSHENACDRYPVNAAVFTGGNPADDCYDNSVRFTDSLMGQLFSELQGSRSSLLYFSDHALMREPNKAVVYHHAGTRPPHEALQVPMFLWFSPQVAAQNTTTGDVNTLWSTVNNNRLAELWLGIHRQNAAPETLSGYQGRMSGQASVMDTTGRVYDWNELTEQKQ